MSRMQLTDPGDIVITRRAALGTALLGFVALGLGACGGGTDATGVVGDSSDGDADAEGSALGGVPVEVWRDPG